MSENLKNPLKLKLINSTHNCLISEDEETFGGEGLWIITTATD